jgi:hypothetical protein
VLQSVSQLQGFHPAWIRKNESWTQVCLQALEPSFQCFFCALASHLIELGIKRSLSLTRKIPDLTLRIAFNFVEQMRKDFSQRLYSQCQIVRHTKEHARRRRDRSRPEKKQQRKQRRRDRSNIESENEKKGRKWLYFQFFS